MNITQSSLSDVQRMFSQGHRVIPVLRQLFADAETPLAIYRKLAKDKPGSFLLESAEQGGLWSRFSFIGVSSYGVLTEYEGRPVWLNYGLSPDLAFAGEIPETFLDALDALYTRWKSSPIEGMPPLTGALVGFIGWEAIREIEFLPHKPEREIPIPNNALSFSREVVVIDHKFGTVTLISNLLALEEVTQQEFDEASRRLDQLEAEFSLPGETGVSRIDLALSPKPHHRITADEFKEAVSASKKHVISGDVFQVVISQRFDLETNVSPLDVYRVLRSLNPSPYMYLLQLEDSSRSPFAIIGSSPEALVKVNSGRVFTHPIAGSRPRGESPEKDQQLENDLLHDQKERAEHLMLVDLARNDLLKVCEPTSVEVTEFMRVERFSHIMHIVSSVEGNLKEDLSPVDVFRATFPAGTLSGAPKPRALEIIDDLEVAQRGVYGGVVGYFDFAGDADLAIAIRTVTLTQDKAYVQAGAGIVLDSDPQTEYEETINKAAAPLRAVAIAQGLEKL